MGDTPEEAIEKIKAIIIGVNIEILKALIAPTILVFLNIAMIIYYEHQERSLFYIVLQTFHLVAIVILSYVFIIYLKGNLEVKKQARKSISKIEKIIENEKN